MSRFLYGFALVVLAIGTGLVVRFALATPGEHPPHAAPPEAEATGTALPLAAVGGDEPAQVIANLIAWIEGEQRAQETARMATAGSSAVSNVVSTGSREACDNIPAWFPHDIAWRESNCIRGLDTSNGYYSFAQIAGFHWFGGICDGLTWTIPAEEDECVDRLSQHGTRLGPWGG